MGEVKRGDLVVRRRVVEALGLETASGRLKVRWDENAQATAQGQMAFFFEFLPLPETERQQFETPAPRDLRIPLPA